MYAVQRLHMKGQPPVGFAAGDLGYCSDRLAHCVAGGAAANPLVGTVARTVFTQTADGSATGTAAASVLAAGVGTRTIPAGTLQPGATLRLSAAGVLSTATVTAGTLTLAVRLGSVVLTSTTAFSLGLGVVKQPWALTAIITCRTNGSAGTFMANGEFALYGAGLVAPTMAALVPAGGGTNGLATVGTLADQLLDLTAQFSVTSASDVLVATSAAVEVLV